MYSSYKSTATSQLNEEASLGILKHLNKQELEKLLNDENEMGSLINDDQQMKRIELDKETLLASSRSVAEYNLAQEPKLTTGKRQLARAYEQCVTIQKEYDKNKQKLDYKSSQYNLDTILALLQTEAAKSEEETEDMSNKFLDGNMEVDEFLEQYVPQRTAAHQRKIKVEKMQEIMAGGGGSSAGAGLAPVVPPRGTFAAIPPGAAPYLAGSNWGPSYPNSNVAMPNPAAYLPR